MAMNIHVYKRLFTPKDVDGNIPLHLAGRGGTENVGHVPPAQHLEGNIPLCIASNVKLRLKTCVNIL